MDVSPGGAGLTVNEPIDNNAFVELHMEGMVTVPGRVARNFARGIGIEFDHVERFGLPADFEALEALPGVGHKTASVVMSQAFGVPAFPVDTHIHRLAQRWKLASGKNVADTESALKRAFCEESWNKLPLRMIFYGREYCSARGCDGTVCEICRTLFPDRKRPVNTKKG